MKDKSQLIIYSIFAIIALLVIFGLASKVITLSRENNILKQAVMENQALAEYRLGSINILRDNLKQCGGNYSFVRS